MIIIKKIFCIICTLIILISISIVPVTAEDTTLTTTSTVNEWTVQHWSTVFGDNFDVSKYTDDVISHLRTLSNSTHQLVDVYSTLQSAIIYTTDDDVGYYKKISDSISFVGLLSDNLFEGNKFSLEHISSEDFTGTYNSYGKYYYEVSTNLFNLSDNRYYIIDDLDEYNKIMTVDFNYKENIFYCPNPIDSFIKFIQGVNIDLNKVVAPEGFTKSGIKYSYSFDSPFNNYGIKPYESELENYVTAGLFSDLNIYYNSEFVNGSEHEHAEDITFYVDMTVDGKDGALLPDYHNYFDTTLYDYYHDGGKLPEESLSAFMNAHFKAVHFEKDSYSLLDYFNPGLGENKYTALSDFITVDMINGKFYLKFTMKSQYTLVGSIFNGIRITHSCKYINPTTGNVGGSGNGLGSDESEADDSLSRPPTKEELKDYGFQYGYPNTSGSFPYKITIYRNGIEYFQMYFNKMPSVSATYYSDKCIDYGVNVMNTKCYMFFKEQKMSKQFDFVCDTNNMYDSGMIESGSVAGNIYHNYVFEPLDDITSQLLTSLLNVNVSEFNNTYTLHFWTNYSGTFENMSGFYVKFNWDLANSGHFQKNNSDDDYDYSTDFVPDESFTDNNGNIHGGAVELPTNDPAYSGFNNGDFSFDENNLWSYANSFLNFVAKAFKVLPPYVWQLISCGIVIAIICRIAGR